MQLNKLLLFVVLGIAVLFNSCDEDFAEFTLDPETGPEIEGEEINSNPPIYPQITSVQMNQMVVDLGDLDLSYFEKFPPEDFPYDRDNVVSCPCGDPKLKLLTFPDDFDVETAVATVRKDNDSRVKADRNYKFGFPVPVPVPGGQDVPVVDPNTSTIVNQESLDLGFGIDLNTSNNNEIPVIVIVDTGIYPNAFRPNEITLSKPNMVCGTEETTGWNFVDNNDDLYDDIMHGTLVTKRIAKRISELDMDKGTTTNYSILPLKVFSGGEGDYFKVVCAFSYIHQLIEGGMQVQIINASFGSNLESLTPTDLLVLKSYIDKLDQNTIIVASAGNELANNDQTPHFPSGYSFNYENDSIYEAMDIIPSNNIVAVAGYEGDAPSSVRLATAPQYYNYGSNFGQSSVDLAAPWSFPILEVNADEKTILINGLQGTSYSAAYVSGDLLYFLVNESDGITTPNPFPAFLSDYYGIDRVKENNPIAIKDGKYVE